MLTCIPGLFALCDTQNSDLKVWACVKGRPSGWCPWPGLKTGYGGSPLLLYSLDYWVARKHHWAEAHWEWRKMRVPMENNGWKFKGFVSSGSWWLIGSSRRAGPPSNLWIISNRWKWELPCSLYPKVYLGCGKSVGLWNLPDRAPVLLSIAGCHDYGVITRIA